VRLQLPNAILACFAAAPLTQISVVASESSQL